MLRYVFIVFCKMKKLVVLLLVVSGFVSIAQDPHFSQVYTSSMYLNPALTGALNGWVSNAQYRNQWPRIKGYRTVNLGLQKGLDSNKLGFGITILNDNAGNSIYTTALGANAAKRWDLGDDVELGLGIGSQFYQKSVDYTSLTFGDMIDNKLGFISDSTSKDNISIINFVNFSVGIDLKIFNGNVGFTTSNLFEPNESFTGTTSKLPRRYTIYGKYEFNFAKNWFITPLVKYENQASFDQVLIGGSTRYKFALLFIGIRREDAVILGAGVNFERIRFNYSFDVTTSGIDHNATGGSHEIGLIFRFGGGEAGYDKMHYSF